MCKKSMFYVYYSIYSIFSVDAEVVGIAGREIWRAILDLNHRAVILKLKALVLRWFITVTESAQAHYL